MDAVTELQRKLSHYENEMNRMRTEMDRLIKKDNDAIVNPPTLGDDSERQQLYFLIIRY